MIVTWTDRGRQLQDYCIMRGHYEWVWFRPWLTSRLALNQTGDVK